MFDNGGVVLCSFLGFAVLYLCLSRFFETSKQRSWILTGLSSGFTSLAAVPYFFDFLSSGGHANALRPSNTWSDTVVAIFQGYLISDLLVGSIFYRQHITLATGWTHHILYFLLIQYITSVGWSNIFCLALIMEIPTMLLALGSLDQRLRNDYLFAVVFFSTRILLHVALIVAHAGVYFREAGGVPGHFKVSFPTISETNQTLVDVQNVATPKSLNSPLPALFFLSAFPMHCMWFAGCIRGILRRRVTATNTKADVPIALVSTPAVRIRFHAIRGRLHWDHEVRERLRARVQAAYGSARERVWRRGARPVQVAVACNAVEVQST
ncbi:putative protein [Rhizoctonia solani AG-1 IB]|uniref:TLC domain-containing protein n=1 Tax=Thanatephorus cucumeris (strain AG1-IB / isolate 7/3/14) TaxID=1108050 RepID=A0A0B7G2Z0_THACB|nr:putative protein [Rhizoctonia solani AG-1 IB]